MTSRVLAGTMIAALVLAGAGCHLGVCGQSREMHLEGPGTAGPTPTIAVVDLVENADSDSNGLWLSWAVQVDPFPADPVTAARLRAGTPDAPRDAIYELPLSDHITGATTVTSGSIDIRREGGLSFEQWWERLSRTPVFVEIVLAGDAAPIGIGLQVTRSHDWEDFYCD
jgi:hypothetical protein